MPPDLAAWLKNIVRIMNIFNCRDYIIFSFKIFNNGVYLNNNVMRVPGIWQSDSVIHTGVWSLFQILFPFRLL